MTKPAAYADAVGAPFPRVRELIFSNWQEALHQARLSPTLQTVYAMAITGYVEYCAHNAISVTIASAQAYPHAAEKR